VKPPQLKQKLLLAGYLAVLGLIIWCADHAETRFVFDWLRALPGGDKLGHFLILGGLAFTLNHALNGRSFRMLGHPVLLGSALALAFAATEECTQLWIPGRTFDLADLAADALGIWLLGRLARLTPCVPGPEEP